ncbi:MAG: single-stranded-DNA-specific exonuclease RecJ [Clostridiales bacterium]|nr:single-stranded-DNA-specific exonuclease RecJ [Clostridiales bacterium]
MLKFVQRPSEVQAFSRPDDMHEALYRLLVRRGIGSEAEAQAFLSPDAKDLFDPYLLNDMDKAAAIVRRAMDENKRICIYGDYDVDGVCASSVLYSWFAACGIEAEVYLPSRHNEGYGLNENAVREIAERADLMITVDCGVTSVELVALAKELGLEVVVTDHHRPAETLPDCPVVNPLLNDYPFPALCGAGVAWKLVCALAGKETAMEYVDIAALATVADVVSLTGENRIIVHLGLKHLNARPRMGLDALIQVSGLSEKRITSTMLAFQLGPRLNAGGRIGSARRSFELITARDAGKARALADELEAENTERRRIEQEILKEAEAQLEDFDFPAHRILILSGKDWNAGVIGLAASRLVEKYHYPVIMLADQGDHMTGSCRSIEGVDIHAALCACAEHLARFGGHKQAAGLTLLPECLADFRAAMDKYLFENIPPSVYIPVETYDIEMDFGSITPGFIAALESLQPTGFGNPAPVFRATAQVVEARTVGADGAHLKLMLSQDSHRLNAIAFRAGHRAETLAGETDILFTPKINAYMGRSEVQLEVRAIADSDVFARISAKIEEETALHCNFLTEMFYNKKINRYAENAPAVDMEMLRGWLLKDPVGTLILTADLSEAVRIFRSVGDAVPDLYIGKLPDDPRAFNALCVCPCPGEIRGYRRIVLAGMPDEFPVPGCAEAYIFGDSPAWFSMLPDIGMMREVWKALGRIFVRPVSYRNLRQLTHLVCADTGMDPRTVTAAILSVYDMDLVELDLDVQPMMIRKSSKKKAEPDESALWRTLQRWRNE